MSAVDVDLPVSAPAPRCDRAAAAASSCCRTSRGRGFEPLDSCWGSEDGVRGAAVATAVLTGTTLMPTIAASIIAEATRHDLLPALIFVNTGYIWFWMLLFLTAIIIIFNF